MQDFCPEKCPKLGGNITKYYLKRYTQKRTFGLGPFYFGGVQSRTNCTLFILPSCFTNVINFRGPELSTIVPMSNDVTIAKLSDRVFKFDG